jgi:flagellar biosynthesis regulator FlaF
LHVGGATPASVAAVVTVIFLLIFAMSFAFGPVPEGERKFTTPWFTAWFRASAPRLVVAGAFSVGIFVASALWGGGTSSSASICENPVPPLSGGAITDARLVVAIASFNDMTAAAQSGDTERVRTLFYTTDAHNLTHDIDRTLRQNDAGAAKTLCVHVIELENQVGGPFELGPIAQQTRNLAADLENARGIFAASTIVTPVVTTGLDFCSQPSSRITALPLSPQRLQSAIDAMRQAAQRATSGDATGAQEAFFEPHNLSHDIDTPLRAVNNDLAVELCKSIVAIELHLGLNYDAEIMQTEAEKTADLIQQAGEALGILS